MPCATTFALNRRGGLGPSRGSGGALSRQLRLYWFVNVCPMKTTDHVEG
jgi:hypothetical protein